MGVEQSAAVVTPSIDRINALIYPACYALIYFSAPVIYVGVVHAALCDQLGASATVANLPASAYFFGFVAPVLLTWIVPKRLERHAATGAYVVTAASLLAVSIALAFPFADTVRLGVVIAQALASGFSDSTAIVTSISACDVGQRSKVEPGRSSSPILSDRFSRWQARWWLSLCWGAP